MANVLLKRLREHGSKIRKAIKEFESSTLSQDTSVCALIAEKDQPGNRFLFECLQPLLMIQGKSRGLI